MRVPTRSLVVLAFALAACRSDSLPLAVRAASFGDPGPAVAGLGTAADLRAHKAAWLAAGITDYVVMEHASCFCGGREFEPAVVEVRDRQVTRVWSVETGERFVPREGTLLSVEKLFDRAIDVAERGQRVIVKYDRALGYPVHLSLGEPERDAGVIYALSNLRRL